MIKLSQPPFDAYWRIRAQKNASRLGLLANAVALILDEYAPIEL